MHESLGVIDVSTLGKLLVEGPDAGGAPRPALPEPLLRSRGRPHPLRRAHHRRRPDHGRRHGRPPRRRPLLRHDHLDRLRRASYEWFEWWNAVWGYDVEIVNVTGALAAINLAGPRAREALARAHRRRRLERGASRYLDAASSRVAGVPCLALRIGFVGELGYELHCAASAAEHVWDALVAAGARAVRPRAAARPAAREGARDRRPGHRLRVEPALGRDAVDRQARQGRLRRPVGRSSTSQERGVRERLVGFTLPAGALPLEGAQVVRDGRVAGRVTSARRSERARPRDRARLGAARLRPRRERRSSIRIDGALHAGDASRSRRSTTPRERLRS